MKNQRRSMEFGTGIERTLAPQSGRDTLGPTGHYQAERWRHDYDLAKQLGVCDVRIPFPWDLIERVPGTYDFSLMDPIVPYVTEALGLTIIADPLHHTSFPRWLDQGFLNPRFVASYVAFVRALALRYGRWVKVLTPCNEPTCTADFCGDRGFWYPYTRGDASYVTMVHHMARATAEAIHAFTEIVPDAMILHIDTFQHHLALDAQSEPRVRFLQERRFLFDKLLLGWIAEDHALFPYLLQHGFPRSGIEWHQRHPAPIHERGGNYYPLSQEELREGQTAQVPAHDPLPLSDLIRVYHEELRLPLSFRETNIQGRSTDKVSWFKYTLEQCEIASSRGIPIESYSWYPLLDCKGWKANMLQGPRWGWDRQGLIDIEPRSLARQTTLFFDWYRHLATEKGATSRDLPAFRFGRKNLRTLKWHLPQMAHWDWTTAPA